MNIGLWIAICIASSTLVGIFAWGITRYHFAQKLHQTQLQLMQAQTYLQMEREQQVEKLQVLDQAKTELTLQFENLANRILDEKTLKFTEQHKVSLTDLLTPLKEQIKDFQQHIHTSQHHETQQRTALITEIRQLQEMTQVLRGPTKHQGLWGELILQRLLELTGLKPDREYKLQVTLKDKQGRSYQPDVIVYLPDNREVIIDAKLSLVAYQRYCQAELPEERELAMQTHIQALRTHIKQLSEKNYQQLTGNTLDFVLLFMPVESAFSMAIQYDPSLYDEALARNVVLVTPTTLIAILRTISNIWRIEQQNSNAQQIAEQAGDMYDKFVTFVDDLEGVGTKLSATQKAYDNAMVKLQTGKGNLIKRADDLRSLGAKTSKQLKTVALIDKE
ncbi:MAG: DNA recombination protein RmuC [Gammaproteobacteria bacterium]